MLQFEIGKVRDDLPYLLMLTDCFYQGLIRGAFKMTIRFVVELCFVFLCLIEDETEVKAVCSPFATKRCLLRSTLLFVKEEYIIFRFNNNLKTLSQWRENNLSAPANNKITFFFFNFDVISTFEKFNLGMRFINALQMNHAEDCDAVDPR